MKTTIAFLGVLGLSLAATTGSADDQLVSWDKILPRDPEETLIPFPIDDQLVSWDKILPRDPEETLIPFPIDDQLVSWDQILPRDPEDTLIPFPTEDQLSSSQRLRVHALRRFIRERFGKKLHHVVRAEKRLTTGSDNRLSFWDTFRNELIKNAGQDKASHKNPSDFDKIMEQGNSEDFLFGSDDQANWIDQIFKSIQQGGKLDLNGHSTTHKVTELENSEDILFGSDNQVNWIDDLIANLQSSGEVVVQDVQSGVEEVLPANVE